MAADPLNTFWDNLYERRLRDDTKRFWHYRQKNTPYREADYQGWWRGKNFPLKSVPRGDNPGVQFPDADPAIYRRNDFFGNVKIDDITDPTKLRTTNSVNAYNRVNEVKNFFAGGELQYEFIQTLGYGGNGVCVRYEAQAGDDIPNVVRDIAVKYPLRSWQSDSLRAERELTRKFHRAAHIIQTLDPEDVGGPPLGDFKRLRPIDDSSDEEESSGDEDISLRPVKVRKRRADLTQEQRATKKARWNPLIPEPSENQNIPDFRRDYMITEYATSGDLTSFISLAASKKQAIPVRVLWRFWLCLIKMVTALAFPPRKFHPEWSARGTEDLDEVYPDNNDHYQRMKRYVHFDLDPTNIFVFDFEDSHEHRLAPRLKLADFGLCREVKTYKRDIYYEALRRSGKLGYYAPEQFSEEWDFLSPIRNGRHVSEHPNLGNYGPHTNVWGIGNVMFNFITGHYPPVPPQASFFDVRDDNGDVYDHLITYGGILLDNDKFQHVPYDMKLMVVRCMAHAPAQRPDIRELMRHARNGLNNSEGAETTAEVWDFHWALYSAPTGSSASQSAGSTVIPGSNQQGASGDGEEEEEEEYDGNDGDGDGDDDDDDEYDDDDEEEDEEDEEEGTDSNQGPLASQNQNETFIGFSGAIFGPGSAPATQQSGQNPAGSSQANWILPISSSYPAGPTDSGPAQQ
ncbi:kinase-like domain-containing protein [Biscogniauxia marginata]|nr:kinase-like domain-containing protein [Biscogniauxia marginata]